MFESLFAVYIGLGTLLAIALAIRGQIVSAIVLFAGISWTSNSYSNYQNLFYLFQLLSGLFMCLVVLRRRGQLGRQIDMGFWTLRYFMVGFCLLGMISFFSSGEGVKGILRFLLCAILISFLRVLSPAEVIQAVKIFVLYLTLGIASVFLSSQSRTALGRDIQGSLLYENFIGHPNYLAYTASLACILFLSLPYKSIKVSVFGSLICLASILHSQARSALTAVLLGLLILILTPKRKISLESRENSSSKKAVLISALLSILTVAYLGSAAIARLQEINETGGINGANSLGWRFLQWNQAVSVGNQNFWLGVGWQHSEQYLLSGLKVHNSFIQSFVEFGIIGLLLNVLTFGLILINFVRIKWKFAFVPSLILCWTVDAGMFYPALIFILLLIGSLPRATQLESNGIENLNKENFKNV